MVTSRPFYKEEEFSTIEKFHLILGPACNMHCRHCSQTPIKNSCFPVSSEINSDVMRLIESFVKFCITHEKTASGRLRKLVFWGGEPLLYWKTIQKVVSYIYEKYDVLQNNNFRFTMVSNGLLLNDEMIQFFNKYDVRFGLSYDAPYPFAVRGYISDEVCNKVRQLKRYSIHGTFNAYNCNTLLAHKCLQTKFPEAIDIDCSANLLRTFDMPKDIYDYDWDKVRDNVKELRIASQLDDKFALKFIGRFFFENGKQDENGVNKSCMLGNNLLNTTLTGDVVACYNCYDKLGTIYDPLAVLAERSYERLKRMQSPDCKTCRHLDICGGNRCVMNLQDEQHRFYACHDFYWQFYDIVKEEFEKLLYPLTDEDLMWYYKKEEEMKEVIQQFLSEGQRYQEKIGQGESNGRK